MIAFEHDGQFKWRSGELWKAIDDWSAPAIADLNHDGDPEIIIGDIVLNSSGEVLWRGREHGGEGTGENAVLHGSLNCAADLDLDGTMEVIAGKSAYRADGTLYWNANVPDGYPAVGQFDDDPNPEVVLVGRGEIYLLEHDGKIKWGPKGLSPGVGRGGPPTIADVDGDGLPEIGVAEANSYSVYESDGSLKWTYPVRDTSYLTGSSVFDLRGTAKLRFSMGAKRICIFFAERMESCYTIFPGVPARPMSIRSLQTLMRTGMRKLWRARTITVDLAPSAAFM